jgi:hypothetical protein
MVEETHRVQIENLPVTDGDRLRVELVPMPAGDNPWRTQGDYRQEQRRETIRFWITIGSLGISIIGVAATTAVAIWTIRGLA